jgi:TolB-like protein
MPDIFLSYTREDQAPAQRFAEAFQAQGFSVWWDATLRSGEAYDQVTEEALRSARAVVVLWSKRSVASRWVRAEATLADRNRTLVPARIEACDLPIMFELTQTADLSGWNGATSDPAWRAFLADVRRFIEAAATPMRPMPQHPTQAASPQPAEGKLYSIAVLPFINRSGREEDDLFADGVVEDLTVALSANPWRRVVASSATAIYRTGSRDLRQIGQHLGVNYLLEGNVRRVGEALRVTAQLVEAESESILWTRKFDRPLAELSALQEDLVAEVAAHFGVQVQLAAMERALKKPGKISASEAMMRAHAHYSRATRSGWETAVVEAKRAVELNPDTSGGYGVLANAQARLLSYRGGDDPELAREIVHNMRRALEGDPKDPGGLGSVAAVLATLGKPQEALPLAERAVALNPTADAGYLLLGTILVRLGRSDDALVELDALERVAPNSWLAGYTSIWRAVAQLQAGRLDQALEAADRAVRQLPGVEALLQSSLCFAMSNRWDRAQDVLRRLRETDPEISCASLQSLVRYFYCGSNSVEDYLALVRKLWDEAPSEPHEPTSGSKTT